MTTTTTFGRNDHGTDGFFLPVRLAFDAAGGWVIAGTPGSHGDAGWSTVECVSRRELESVAADYPQARMPCWTRIGL
jgi:hypothetical protein